MRSRNTNEGWDDYLAAFHTERTGITEAVLGAAPGDDGREPYDWLVQALPGDGVIVDVGCGSGPLAARTPRRWIGLDRNPAELGRAARAAPGRVVRADAAAAPVRAGGADVVICSMALMLFADPTAAVGEMARLLRVGGLFVALVPATRPLTIRDRVRYARLLAALRLRRMPFRHPGVLDEPRSLLAPAGLDLVSMERRRFAYRLGDTDAAVLWMRSLYLPGLGGRRWHAVQQVAQRWTGSSIGLPLCRLVAVKPA
ncbi:MAG TPA: methyltransferase domain-containing protein [Acidimicrobiales bacterium]|nr:methyltransferase domain-containing protein [Acidimicrobiales bacterium]